MKKILDIIKKLFGNKELIGTAVQVIVEPVIESKPVSLKKKPKKKKKNEPK
jgi:hypothetical protein